MAAVIGNSRIYGYEKKESNCLKSKTFQFEYFKEMTCPPIIGPQVKLFFREETLYIRGHLNSQVVLFIIPT